MESLPPFVKLTIKLSLAAHFPAIWSLGICTRSLVLSNCLDVELVTLGRLAEFNLLLALLEAGFPLRMRGRVIHHGLINRS